MTNHPPHINCTHTSDRHIPGLILHLARQFGNVLERRVAPFDITAQQAALLVHSCSAQGVNPSQLASGLGTDNAGVTRLVDRLEARGLAERRSSPGDRRAILIEPTEAGRALAPQLKEAFREAHAQLLDALSPDDIETLHDLLHRLVHNVCIDESAYHKTASADHTTVGAGAHP